MAKFNVIHRDFREGNLVVQDRGAKCQLKIFDLGLMISMQPDQIWNPNGAVQCDWNPREDDLLGSRMLSRTSGGFVQG